MDKSISITGPRYQHIALDIASKIASGHYKVGDKIYTRSVLSSQYNVSSETARRAISILSDVGIVEVWRGSGVLIKSCEKAIDFVKEYTAIQSVNDLKNEILDCLERQAKENDFLKEMLDKLIDKTHSLKAINPFIPYEITLDANCKHLGETISGINFWHHTAATIVAIRHDDELMMSPGPYAVITKGDVLYFVGDDNSPERVKNYLYL